MYISEALLGVSPYFSRSSEVLLSVVVCWRLSLYLSIEVSCERRFDHVCRRSSRGVLRCPLSPQDQFRKHENPPILTPHYHFHTSGHTPQVSEKTEV